MQNVDRSKQEAAYAAVDRFVESGMTLGLGSGSTAAWVVQRLGEKLSSGELSDVRGIPTSGATMRLAEEVGVPLATLAQERPRITIDGADEISPSLNVIKGHGGALLREKIVAFASVEGLILVADDSKLVDSLGEGPLPVEVEPFGWPATSRALAGLGCEPHLRMLKDDPSEPFVSDGGNYTLDCRFEDIPDPKVLEAQIKNIPGALECGLFVGLARAAVVSGAGGVEVLG